MPKQFGSRGVFTITALGVTAGVLLGAATAAERPNWIVDKSNACGTSNPFPSPDEGIRWYGECRDGRLHGSGTLIWYRGNVETERNEGTFKEGELDGEAITTYPDGHIIVGRYEAGRRHGRFITVKPDGTHIEASYRNGKLGSQRTLSQQEVAAWKRERATQLAATLPEGAPRLADAAPRRAAPVTPAPAPPRAALPVQPGAPPGSTAWAGPIPPAPAAASPAESAPAGWPAAAPWQVTPPANAAAAPVGPGVAVPGGPRPSPSGFAGSRDGGAGIAAGSARGRPSATELARYYAGTQGAATGYETPPAPARARPTLQPTQLEPPGGASRAVAAAANGIADAGDADKLFTQAYRSERAGHFYEAEKIYEQILMQFPSAQSAMLANARLDALRDRANGARAASQAGAARVVAVNAPNPPHRDDARVDRPSLVIESADVGRRVCTVDDLYEDGARWCGVVVRDERSHFRVEVRRVELPGFGTIGIGRSTCTGNTFINWFSPGATVRVPKQCLTFES